MVGSVVLYSVFNPDKIKEFAELFLVWLSKHRFMGPLALIVTMIAFQIMMLPAVILTIGSGFALMKAYNSTWLAITIASISCHTGLWIGTIISLILARYMFRDEAIKLAKKHKSIEAFDRAMATDGFKFLIIIKIWPVPPYSIQNYILGATALPMKHFAVSGIFMLPWVISGVFFGTTFSNIHDAVNGKFDKGSTQFYAMIIGTALVIVAAVFMSILVKKQYN